MRTIFPLSIERHAIVNSITGSIAPTFTIRITIPAQEGLAIKVNRHHRDFLGLADIDGRRHAVKVVRDSSA